MAIAIITIVSMDFSMAQAVKQQMQQTAGQVMTNGIDTVYHDAKDAVGTVYNDGKGVIATIYEDAKAGFKDLYPEVKSAIISIAKALGIAAEHVYGVLVKQYVVEGVKWLTLFLTGLILIIIGGIKVGRFNKLHKPLDYTIVMPLAILTGGIVMVCCVNYNAMFMGLINPEYGAINYILEYAQSMIN